MDYKVLSTVISKRAIEYPFPEFISFLRSLNGQKRGDVSQKTGIPISRLFCLETGKFRRKLKSVEIMQLSEYFDIEYELLKEKADSYYSALHENRS